MSTYKFKSRYGATYEIKFVKTRYAVDGTLAIMTLCWSDHGSFWEPYASLTVNLGKPLGANEAYLDDNNVPDLGDFVLDNGWARNVGSARSGWCTYQKVEFTDEFLNEVCEEAS